MKKIFILAAALALVLVCLLVYPKIEFLQDGKLYSCSFSEDFSRFEENPSYNELYFYYEKYDISLKNFQAENFLFFYVLSFDYVAGDFRQTQFLLTEDYVANWLQNAKIEENPAGLDLGALIAGKTAVVGNTRYTTEAEKDYITYKLDGKWDTLYVFESEGLTVIQVGEMDELPKYIAYQ